MAGILLIEPDAVLAAIYNVVLVDAGHSVRVCATAQSGIEAADVERPDIAILELQLVAHSGVEFLYEFRSYSDWQDIPIIVLSQVPRGEFTDNRELLVSCLGVRDYLYKPSSTLNQLIRTVNRLAPVAIVEA